MTNFWGRSTAETNEILCIFKKDEGEGVGFIHQDVKEAKSGLSQRVNISDVGIWLTMSWKYVEIASERNQSPDDIVGQLHDHGIERLRALERTGELSALIDGTTNLQQAVDLTPLGHPKLPVYLFHLGTSFAHLFKRTGELSDIAHAIALQQKAVNLTAVGHAGLPYYYSNLGNSFSYRFECTGEPSDIASAIIMQQKVVELTSTGGHVNVPIYVNNLRKSLTRELSDIVNAVSLQQKTVELVPTNRADLPGYLSNLGASFDRHIEDLESRLAVNPAARCGEDAG
ncbi:hypothetical protein DFP72DRAFT_1063945 [Ephemerocybe angulata]|uniref:Uncharacterized protein n=1 Tax=Ephemerocybe angulata TaxID=980116 RepID=A0A8H6I6Q0_9AGAR|nr:hypothetical protein DFP72DRAFT_1063945 [Tulosesus angulatus]